MSMLPDVASLSDSAAEASQAVKSVLDEVIAQEWQSSLKAFALKLGMDQCKLVEIASGHDTLAGCRAGLSADAETPQLGEASSRGSGIPAEEGIWGLGFGSWIGH